MPGSWPQQELPNLTTQNCEIKSPATRKYNCIAWAAGENFRNWWPDPFGIGYWPPSIERSVTVDAFMRAYGTLGFTLCFDGNLEQWIEKIALFGKGQPGAETPTHAALQLDSGKWTSKLGPFEDINHTPVDAVGGPVYGRVICYMGRHRRSILNHIPPLLQIANLRFS
jgi:hypothetical protein